MAQILVVEDEANIALALSEDLRLEGYRVDVVNDGETATRRATEQTYDLVLLDLNLPGKDGLEVCRQLRRDGLTVPIIILTARDQEADKILGLETGADDYVTKPFSPRELRARIKAALRRTSAEESSIYEFENVQVDFSRGEVRRSGTPVRLSALEFKLLEVFIRNRGRLLTRNRLLDQVWGRDTFLSDRVVDNHIVSLRRKIEPDPTRPRHLINVRGMGYRFED